VASGKTPSRKRKREKLLSLGNALLRRDEFTPAFSENVYETPADAVSFEVPKADQ